MKKKRVERCKKLLQRFTVARARNIVFADGKLFTLNPVFNSQNERILGDSLADATAKSRLHESAKKPQSVILWGGVTSSGKTALVFAEAVLKINAAIYKDILGNVLKPTSAQGEDGPGLVCRTSSHTEIGPLVLRAITRWTIPCGPSWRERDEIDETYLRATCEAFVGRLKNCVKAKGDHFKNR
ncbi:unnamed protein product [Nippostrongylus brasiliensis]|uniref:Zeta_toxin domain-containing protein n=1 Tax=Nippostrongylus brasiliensis TaxID=27835 RepID=A0A0N4XZR9_NIPBR|nr:unnamed protein product [Nippostrongylus brasiliensis]